MKRIGTPAVGRPELRAAFAAALIVALVGAGIAWILVDARQRELATAQANLDRVAALAAARLGAALANAGTLIDLAAADHARSGRPDPQRQETLRHLVAGSDLVLAIDVLRADGSIERTSRSPAPPAHSFAGEAFFPAARRGAGPGAPPAAIVSERRADPLDGGESFVIARPLPSASPDAAGVVTATLSAVEVARTLGAIVPTGARIVLAREGGGTLAQRADAHWTEARSEVDRIAASAAIGPLSLRVAVDMAVATVLADWREHAANLSAVGTVLLAVIAAVLGLVVRQAARLRAAGEAASSRAALLRDAIESVSGAVTLFDAAERLVLWNSAFSEHFARHGAAVRPGMTYEEVLRLALAAQAAPQHKADEDWIAERLAQFRNPPSMVEQRFPDGRWFLVAQRRTSDGGSIAIRTDITSLRAQQDATRTLAERLVLATRSAGIGVWDCDMATGATVWDPEMYRIFEADPGDADLVAALRSALHPDDRPAFLADREAALRGMRDLAGEYRLQRRDGTLRAVRLSGVVHRDADGQPSRFVGTAWDVTERRQLEEQLRLAVEAFDGPVYLTDAAQRLVSCNERLRALVPGAESWARPGTPVSALISAVACSGLLAAARGREDAWIAERLARRDDPRGPFEIERADGVWLLMTDSKLGSGGTLTVGADITALKRTEQALRDSEARFRAFAESASDWYWEQDEALRFTYLSPERDRNFPIPGSSLGKTRREIGALDVGTEAWDAHEADLAARRPFKDFRYVRVDAEGRQRHVSVSGQPWFDAAGRFCGYRGVGRDITATVEQERAVGETQRRFLDAIEALDVGIALWDAQDRLVVCNSSYKRLAGPAAGLLERGVTYQAYLRFYVGSDLVDLQGMAPEAFVAWRLARHRDPGQAIHVRFTGRWHLVAERRTAEGGILTTTTDIEEIKLREAELEAASSALADSQARLNAVFETVADAIVMIEEDGTIVAANASTKRLLGYDAEELVGENVGMLMPSHDRDRHDGYISRYARTGKAQVIGRGRKVAGRRKDGTEIPLFLSISETHVNGKRYFTGVLRDLTDALRADEQRVLLESRLKQSERLSVIGLLTGGVAHELNNVLTPILLFARLLKDDLALDSPAQGDLDKVIQAALRGQQIVRNLRAQARSEERQETAVDLDKVVREATDLVRPMLKPGVRLDVAPAIGQRLVRGDETQLVQSVVNLMVNANEAMLRDGGRIWVLVERVEIADGRPRLLDKMEDGPAWAISVEDTGRGMDGGTLERVSQPYFSTKDKDGNSGLGLSIVRDIMRAHRGGISLESAPGQGSIVRLVLPMLQEAPPAAPDQRQAPPAQAAAAHGEQVLVVDDEPEVFEALMAALRRSGFDPVGSTRASEALAIVGERGSRVAAAVIDLAMPEMPGHVLALRLRSLSPGLPILVVTARRTAHDDDELATLGIRGILDKPVLPGELASAVAAMLSGRDHAGAV